MTTITAPDTSKNEKLDFVFSTNGCKYSSKGLVSVFSSNSPSPVRNIISNNSRISGINNYRYIIAESHKTVINNIDYVASINGYDLPNDTVKTTALAILEFFRLHNIPQNGITPLSEGGIGFEFIRNNSYYNIKIDNEGDGVFYKETINQVPQGWDLTFPQLYKKIKSEFDGM